MSWPLQSRASTIRRLPLRSNLRLDGMRSVVHAFQEIVHFGAGERLRGSDGRTVQIRLKPARAIWETCRHRFFNP